MALYGAIPDKAYSYSTVEVDSLIAGLRPTSEGSYIASGAGVANVSGLIFRVSAGEVFIRGELFSFPQTDITLTAAHATLPRQDIIVADSSTLTYVLLTGTAGATPELPNVDPQTQAQITLIQVPPAATVLPNIVQTVFYREATETTVTVSGARIVSNSTNNPLAGTKCIEGTLCVTDDWVKMTSSGVISVTAANQLVLNIRSKAAWVNQRSLQLTFFNGSTKVGQTAIIDRNTPGFSSSVIASYQQLVFPIGSFQIPAGSQVTVLEARVKGSSTAIGFYLDEIYLESSSVISTPPPISNLAEAHAALTMLEFGRI